MRRASTRSLPNISKTWLMPSEAPASGYPAAKRTFDILFAAVFVIVLSPVLLLLATVVKATSPGPVFYRGVRAGRFGRPFHIFKFRTMSVNAETLGTTTKKDDPRVTRVGRFLRRYKLDELPQLFNVLAGQMSIVGPRPEVFEHTNAYVGRERRILDVRPGITDFASIELVSLDELLGSDNAHENFVQHVRPRKNALRVKYVDEQSFAVDLKIIWLTLQAILRKFPGQRAARTGGAHPRE